MTRQNPVIRFALSGAAAGALSTVVFAGVHHALISDIWFSLAPMLLAGALCGSALAVSYALTAESPEFVGWIRFNGVFVALIVVLGVASIVVFEPITTAAAVLAANRPPNELFERSLPFMGAFTVLSTVVVSLTFGRRPRQVAALFVTTALLMAALGMNVGIFGLVEIPTSALPLIAMLLALVLVLAGTHAVTFALLERRAFSEVRSGKLRAGPR